LQHTDLVKMVEARMASLRKHKNFTADKQIYTGGSFIKKRDIEQAQVILGYKSVDCYDDMRYPMIILSSILGGGMSSRLFQEIREKRGLVYSVYSFNNTFTQNGIFGIYAGLEADEIKNYMPVVADEIKKICNEYVTDAELNRVKVQHKAGMLMALESSSSTAEMIARRYLLHNKFMQIDEIIEKIDSVSKEQVMRAAQMIFGSPLTYTLLGNLKDYPQYEQVQKWYK